MSKATHGQGEIKSCTHTCSACGQGIYSEHERDFLGKCFGCNRRVTIQYTPNSEQQVMVW